MQERRAMNQINQDAIQASIDALREEVNALRVMYNEHDKILVRGNGVPSLQEMYRNLARTVTEFIENQKQREERDRVESNKLKWILIGAGVPLIIGFSLQVIVFFFKIYPLLVTLSKTTP